MNLPLVDVFVFPYEVWSKRDPTEKEMMEHLRKTGQMIHYINDKLIARISNALEAANHISSIRVDNGLTYFINDALDKDSYFKTWRSCMPSKTPKELINYQQNYPLNDFTRTDQEIKNIGQTISERQYLFHGGLWPGGDSFEFKTQRPLSTSFCPQVALRNAEHRGKAYDDNQIDLLVLRATSPQTNVFSFRRAGTRMGHENEILFASGAKLTLLSRTLIRENYPVSKWGFPDKTIDIYVLEVNIT